MRHVRLSCVAMPYLGGLNTVVISFVSGPLPHGYQDIFRLRLRGHHRGIVGISDRRLARPAWRGVGALLDSALLRVDQISGPASHLPEFAEAAHTVRCGTSFQKEDLMEFLILM